MFGILLVCCTLVSAEESDGTTKVAVNIAGYLTKHDVTEHSNIDKDIRDIEAEMTKKTPAGFTEALKIYNEGKNSQTISKMRTLAEFWPGTHTNSVGLASSAEPFLKMFDDYFDVKNFDPHVSTVAALTGADSATLGLYAMDRVAKEFDFRSQVAKKNIKFQIVMIYALHELEIAVFAYKENKGADVAQRYLDVWWAFYAGGLETGDGKGFGAYVLAERRSKFFGTDTAIIGNGGVSKVNDILLKATFEISRLMSTTGNTAAMDKIVKCVRAQLKVPLIQGCLQYGYKTDPTTAYESGETWTTATGYNSEFARKGELWSFCSGVLPLLHAVDAAAAQTLLDQVSVLNIESATVAQWSTIKGVFSPTNLNKMGVKCADVGGFVDKTQAKTSATTLGSDFTVCTDTAEVNADADSGQCTGDWMSRSVATTEGMTAGGAAASSVAAASTTSAAVGSPAATLPAMLAGVIIAGIFAR